jgi:sensor domain CHASE-containing protein
MRGMSRTRIRTLMILVAFVAVSIAVAMAALDWMDIHIHDTYLRLGPPPRFPGVAG